MIVEIIGPPFIPSTYEGVNNLIRNYYSGPILISGKPEELKRIIKKLIRTRDYVFQIHTTCFSMSIPLMLYYNIKHLLPKQQTSLLIDKDLSFECTEALSEKEETLLVGVFKKVKDLIKESQSNSKEVPLHKILNFLPLSAIIKVKTVMTYLQLYQFLFDLSKMKKTEYIDLQNELLNSYKLESLLLFNQENLETYIAYEEK